MPDNNAPSEASAQVLGDERYIGFCDILGFSNRILSDFDGTLKVYQQFAQSFASLPAPETEATMYSDAILITGTSLGRIACAIQNLWFVALINDLMIRGAIAKGRYWEQREGNHMLVASDALARAVKLERSIGIPAVVIADDIEIPDQVWLNRFVNGIFQTPILHFRDRNIVNPFNIFWYRSAASRATNLMTASPAHKDKYLWFLALHEAVGKGLELVPHDALARFVRDGILRLQMNPAEAPPQQ
jgi:hypothetical protein